MRNGGIITKDKIIGALIGLARACGNNPKTENTDEIIRSSLAVCADGNEIHDREQDEIVEKIRAEKNAVSPGCAACKSPCGNTSDFDMTLLLNDKNSEIKHKILSELCKLAEQGNHPDLFCKALPMISYELGSGEYEAILKEIREQLL